MPVDAVAGDGMTGRCEEATGTGGAGGPTTAAEAAIDLKTGASMAGLPWDMGLNPIDVPLAGWSNTP
jgi:hypothetical protein